MDTGIVEEIKFVILESLWTSVTVMRNYEEVSTYNNDNYSDGDGGDDDGVVMMIIRKTRGQTQYNTTGMKSG
jgi:hypothetical protein